MGLVHVIIGALIVVRVRGVHRQRPGSTVGVIVAAVSMIANFLWLPVYPFWAIIIIVIDALVIWALMVHTAASCAPTDTGPTLRSDHTTEIHRTRGLDAHQGVGELRPTGLSVP